MCLSHLKECPLMVGTKLQPSQLPQCLQHIQYILNRQRRVDGWKEIREEMRKGGRDKGRKGERMNLLNLLSLLPTACHHGGQIQSPDQFLRTDVIYSLFIGGFLKPLISSKQASLQTPFDVILQKEPPPDICLIPLGYLKISLLGKLFHSLVSFSSSVKTVFVIPSLKVRGQGQEECERCGDFY